MRNIHALYYKLYSGIVIILMENDTLIKKEYFFNYSKINKITALRINHIHNGKYYRLTIPFLF